MNTTTVMQKRKGLSRIWHATGYSLRGLRAGWFEPAFRQELLLAVVLVPLAVLLSTQWLEAVVLIGVVALVLITELLNTAIESTVDRIGPEWHELSGRAKDMGSAAVLLSLINAAAIWACVLWPVG